ncbi:MAG: ribbon-helix-helix domain-containing protein [Alphaproteobacteria bacterium]|jgi:predicted DNA-binding ribbon-helix-helix protein|nr:ribbon-helix-helix domain-containing protein [Alphaproteobacteria bacterium]
MNKISINIDGHSTSISIEKEFLDELDKISKEMKISRNKLVSNIDKNFNADTINLSSKIRIYILKYRIENN